MEGDHLTLNVSNAVDKASFCEFANFNINDRGRYTKRPLTVNVLLMRFGFAVKLGVLFKRVMVNVKVKKLVSNLTRPIGAEGFQASVVTSVSSGVGTVVNTKMRNGIGVKILKVAGGGGIAKDRLTSIRVKNTNSSFLGFTFKGGAIRYILPNRGHL